MAGDYLLDTNIVVALFNHDRIVAEEIRKGVVFLPTIVLGELYFGAFASKQVAKNLSRIEEFAGQVATLAASRVTAVRYGNIKNRLREIGRPIPDNDIWIAAIALQHGLTLATRDDHFDHVDGLNVVRW